MKRLEYLKIEMADKIRGAVQVMPPMAFIYVNADVWDDFVNEAVHSPACSCMLADIRKVPPLPRHNIKSGAHSVRFPTVYAHDLKKSS